MTLSVLLTAFLIFLARVTDVSLGTLRTAFIVRGKRGLAFAVGFFEILVWVIVVAQVVRNMDHVIYFVAFALGFATGTVVGITIEGWFAIGEQVIRVFSPKGPAIAATLREQGFAVTIFKGGGRDGDVYLLFIQVPRRQTSEVIATVRKLDPVCFFTVDDVRVANSVRPAPRRTTRKPLPPTSTTSTTPATSKTPAGEPQITTAATVPASEPQAQPIATALELADKPPSEEPQPALSVEVHS